MDNCVVKIHFKAVKRPIEDLPYFSARTKKGKPYGPYVQGERQTWFHKATGWITVAEGAEKYAPEVIKIFEDAYNSYLEKQ